MSDTHETPDVESIWAVPETLLDPARSPPPKTCACGAVHDWVWWPGRTVRGRTIRARWTPPNIDDVKGCKSCTWQRDRRAVEEEVLRRQTIAGIAPTHRGYSWARVAVQGHHETWVDFAHRVKEHRGLMGVCREDVAASTVLREWRPGFEGVFLSGPVGSGKSLWVSARLTALVSPTSSSQLELTVGQLMERGLTEERAVATVGAKMNVYVTPGGAQKVDALLIDEEEVVRRVELAWKGDQVPLLRIARVQVLAYDDIGTVLIGGSPKARDLARTCIDRLVDLRWREQRPLLTTSNRSMDEVCDAMSRRTADRLRELCPTEVAMRGVPVAFVEGGYSWRRLPPKGRE